MTEITHVYWLAGADAPKGTIGGCCLADDIPSYAIVDDLDLPTEIVSTEEVRESGEVITRHVSPPLFGGRYVYRMRMTLTQRDRDEIPGQALDKLTMQLSAERIEAPWKGTRRTNWWWSHHDEYWRYCAPTTSLRKRWTRAFLDIMTADHPNREAILSEWDDQLERHKTYVKRRNAPQNEARQRYGRKVKGGLVLSRTPRHFQSGLVRQLFVLDTFGRRNQLGPHSPGGTRFRIPASDMQPLCPEWLEDAEISGPVGYAALLAAEKRALAEAESHHQVLCVKAFYTPLLEDWKTRSESALDAMTPVITAATEMDNTLRDHADILHAAEGILVDFLHTVSVGMFDELPPAADTPEQGLRSRLSFLIERIRLLQNIAETAERHAQ